MNYWWNYEMTWNVCKGTDCVLDRDWEWVNELWGSNYFNQMTFHTHTDTHTDTQIRPLPLQQL